MIRAGALREVVTLQRPVETRDAAGGVVTTWQTIDTLPAAVITMRGQEALRAAAMQADHVVRFQLRWRDGVTPAMRLLWAGREYDIRDLDESLRDRGELWITAAARVL